MKQKIKEISYFINWLIADTVKWMIIGPIKYKYYQYKQEQQDLLDTIKNSK